LIFFDGRKKVGWDIHALLAHRNWAFIWVGNLLGTLGLEIWVGNPTWKLELEILEILPRNGLGNLGWDWTWNLGWNEPGGMDLDSVEWLVMIAGCPRRGWTCWCYCLGSSRLLLFLSIPRMNQSRVKDESRTEIFPVNSRKNSVTHHLRSQHG